MPPIRKHHAHAQRPPICDFYHLQPPLFRDPAERYPAAIASGRAAPSALPSYDHRNTQELAVQNISNSILSLWRSPKLPRDPIDSSQRSAASQRFLRVFRRSDRPIPPANACGHAASRHRSCNASGPKLFAGGGHPSSLARNACISASLCMRSRHPRCYQVKV